jgi:hypothetical protein
MSRSGTNNINTLTNILKRDFYNSLLFKMGFDNE